MTNDTPLHPIKQAAHRRKRAEGIPLHRALDDAARASGFQTWGHMVSAFGKRAARAPDQDPRVLADRMIQPGTLTLIAARPRQGKTLLGLAITIESARAGHPALVFSVEETAASLDARIRALGGDPAQVVCDTSDGIDADRIARRLADVAPGAVVLIDFLQALDQPRHLPPLNQQLRDLKSAAVAHQATILALSQVDRGFDPARMPVPGLADLRLPNPVDLRLFDAACFLHDGRITLDSVA